jgi:hypothetical protein
MRVAYVVLVGNLEEHIPLSNLVVNARIILKWGFEKWVKRVG